MMKYELFRNGEQTGIIIDADNEDNAWMQIKHSGIKNRGHSLELFEI